MKTIDGIDFKGKRVIMRVDFNVPLNSEFQITDDSRMRAAVPSIKKILDDGGSVIVMSHLGRPKEGPEDKFSLRHLRDHLSKLLDVDVRFADDCIGDLTHQKALNLRPGQVLLLENLRFYKEETKGDEAFAGKLAQLANFYVNDAFGTAHRAHASTTIIAKFFPNDKAFGYLMANELASIDKVLKDVKRPYTAIIGGAKVSSKIQILENLLDKVDDLIIGGGMMFTFIKAQGGTIGGSLVEDDFIGQAKEIMEKAKAKGVNLHIPADAVIADAFANDANAKTVKADAIPEGWLGLDIGPESQKKFSEVIEKSKTVLWNGPMGVFEMENFAKGTKVVAEALVKATENGAFTLIGGGDSVAAINQLDLADQVSYVSTGGGALLEYMEGKVLPGVQAINE
ncbi:MAG: phosphoglycerate kinase [Bacteroides sp.]|jgi:phosphoglycerate kinase|nr:phosphoglycerate kinase [Bacteroides sp.]